jgi:general stress protein 26
VRSRTFTEKECQGIVVGLAHSKTKKDMAHRVRAINVGALTTLRTFGHTNQREMMVINLDLLAPYYGAASDNRP